MIACTHEELAVLILMAVGVALAIGALAGAFAWQMRRGDRAGRRRYQRDLYASKKDGRA